MQELALNLVKPETFKLLSHFSVDTACHVITDIKAYHATVRKSQLQDIVKRLQGD